MAILRLRRLRFVKQRQWKEKIDGKHRVLYTIGFELLEAGDGAIKDLISAVPAKYGLGFPDACRDKPSLSASSYHMQRIES